MRAVILAVAMFSGPAMASAQTPSAPQDLASQVRALTEAVTALQAALSASQRDVEALKAQLEAIRGALAAAKGGAENRDLATLAQDVELLAAKVNDQEQLKVESGSKYHVRVSGVLLVTATAVRGLVDNLDLPLVALPGTAGDSRGSVSAAVRQSSATLSVFGPALGGARTSGSLAFDFFGGFPGTSEGVTAAHARLRTAAIALDWATTSLSAGQDAPFFSPLSPTSMATVAYPGFASAGNLWTWTPQVAVTHRIATGTGQSVVLQAGLLDPLTGEAPASEYARVPNAGERTGRPGVAGRIAFETTGDAPQAIGIGVYQAAHLWGFDRTTSAWALTADAHLSFGAVQLSGEGYRGQGLAGLGGGAAPAVVFNGDPAVAASSLRVVGSEGGWAEVRFDATPRVSLVGSAGLDQVRGDAQPWLLASNAATPRRNASMAAAVIGRLRSNIMVSAEYRWLSTTTVAAVTARAHAITLVMGMLF